MLTVHEEQLDFIGLEPSLVKKEILQLALNDETIPFVKRNEDKYLGEKFMSDGDASLDYWKDFDFENIECSRLISNFGKQIKKYGSTSTFPTMVLRNRNDDGLKDI